MEVYREGRQLRIDFTVWDQATSKPVGEIWTALEVPDNSSHWQLKIIRVEIEADHQKKSISTFAVNRIIKLANALEVPRLVLDSDGMGRYAWLRMGFKFDSKESEVSLANLLSLFIQNKKIKIEVPNKQDPSRWTLEESMHLLTQFNLKTREKFVEFWAFQPLLVMSLTNGSPELANFKSYFARKDYKIRGFRIGD
jgi:hypothetical protein